MATSKTLLSKISNNLPTIKYVTALLLFGSNGIIASELSLSSSEIVFTRTLIGAAFLVFVFLFSKQKAAFREHKRDLFFIVLSGIAMGVSWVFLFEAYKLIGVSIATLAYYTGPVIVMLISIFVFKQRLSVIKVIGFFGVVIGMLLVNGLTAGQRVSGWGLGYGILAAFMYALMVLFNKRSVHINGLENPMWQISVSFVTVAVFVLFRQGFSFSPLNGQVVLILVLGVVNTGIGCYLYFSSIGHLPVSRVAIVGYLEPLSAVVFSVIFIHEILSITQVFGAALILAGAGLSEIERPA